MSSDRLNSSSWIVKLAVCRDCEYNLIVTEATNRYADYWWYCSNKCCQNHEPGEQLGDQEECAFAKRILK